MNANTKHKQLKYDDEELAQDLAEASLSMTAIAALHKISLRQTYELASGTSRPSIKTRINELIEAGKQTGIRLARSRALWSVRRLLTLAEQDIDRGAALRATTQLLEMGGLLEASAKVGDKQTIEIVLSNTVPKKLTGVYNPSSDRFKGN